jgi:tripartite-type tricarboxylate transporter receptor subunit TctC
MNTFLWFGAATVFAANCTCPQAADTVRDYPGKPIRFVVPFSPGSGSDIVARLIGPKLYESWGQQVVVDNRPSGGGIVAGGIVAAAAPDGHTIMLTSSQFAGAAALYDKLPYDPLKDLTGVAQVGSTPLLLVVAPGLGVKSVRELIALAKQKPGNLTFGSSGIASGTHYAGELFKLAAGIDIVHVPYKGVPEVLTDVMTGRIQYAAMPVLPSMPLVRSGRLLALGVTSAQRVPVLPETPTIAEAALPGFECDGWYGVFVPSRTPRAIVATLAQELSRILQLPDVKERYESQGAIAKATTPEAFGRMVRNEIALRGKVFRAAGAKPD